jgi:hypothetical protein
MHFPAHCFIGSNPVAAPAEITKRMVMFHNVRVANWQKPTHQTVKSYEDKQMNQAKPVISIAEEFRSGCLTRNLHLHIQTSGAKPGSER